MKTLINLGEKFKDRFASQYPAAEESDLPETAQVDLIGYKNEEIQKYHVMFWHRMLRRIYGEPAAIECELLSTNQQENPIKETVVLRKTREANAWNVTCKSEELASKLAEGTAKTIPIEWKYYAKLPSGGFVGMGTNDHHTVFSLKHICETLPNSKASQQETTKFVNALIEEANRTKQLFNPVKEFNKDSRLKLYQVRNVYLANYVSAKYMIDMAKSEEDYLTSEWLKYDPRTDDRFDEQRKLSAEQFEMTRGMFYFSAISYLFMALEGFVNIVFHAFLKKDLRDQDLNLDQRLDLEQKLRLMSSLCRNFNESARLSSAIYSKFKKLKKYRNSLFHAKIENSLKTLCFIEQGFFYNYIVDADENKERLLPADKGDLTIHDVIEVKKIVDEIVDGIVNSMKNPAKMLTEKHVLKETVIFFYVSEAGDITMTIEDK